MQIKSRDLFPLAARNNKMQVLTKGIPALDVAENQIMAVAENMKHWKKKYQTVYKKFLDLEEAYNVLGAELEEYKENSNVNTDTNDQVPPSTSNDGGSRSD